MIGTYASLCCELLYFAWCHSTCMLSSVVQCGGAWCGADCGAVQHSGVEWCGVVRCGVGWSAVACSGVVRSVV